MFFIFNPFLMHYSFNAIKESPVERVEVKLRVSESNLQEFEITRSLSEPPKFGVLRPEIGISKVKSPSPHPGLVN